ncbi:MAG: elongation factor P [Patescibacteria group bacterium]
MSYAYNELRPGVFFIYEGQPFVVLSSQPLRMQQRKPVFQTRMRNLINGKIIEHNFMVSDVLEEADIQKREANFLYAHRGEFWFTDKDNPKNRFKIEESILGDGAKFLKPNTVVTAIEYNGKAITVELPVKMDFKVIEAPPSTRGNTAQGGTKQVKIETGAMINVPLFINEGEVIRVNTETGEYVERASS